ncbi:hypothetical protein [Streptomyces sp. NPDC021224]|uniref:hypothetical protein n=1 Tax=unclassified Streptomyces TaxID=2593676 RepID=UPI0037A50F13
MPDTLRDRIAAALRSAAHRCGEDCPAPTETACHAAHPVQEAVEHHGVITDVYAPISALADVVLPLVAAEREAGRCDGLREGANDLAAVANPHTERGAGVRWAADRLRARVDAEEPRP